MNKFPIHRRKPCNSRRQFLNHFVFSFTRVRCLPPTFFRELLDVSANNESQLEKFIELINAVVNDVRSIRLLDLKDFHCRLKDSSATHDNGSKSQSNGNADSLEQNEDDQQCIQTLQKIIERANQIIQFLKSSENQSGLNCDEQGQSDLIPSVE